ncbi:universal stress protein [Maribacter sp. CXY002]|uniref:universal stress protein n=1 Tax=Maribacter luteocoastalis TaxID=3407671 RepID=UPI003B685B2A
MKKKQILLPTDFSANARNAIEYAFFLLKDIACEFHVLNAYEVGASALSSTMGKVKETRLFLAVKEESERKVTGIVKDLKSKSNNPLHLIQGHSIADSLVNGIGRFAIKNNIDYVFMGTKGSSAVKEVFMGSSTIKVIKYFNYCPIIAVPASYNLKIPRKMVFATNFEHTYTAVELIPLITIAQLWNSEIIIAHVDRGTGLSTEQENCRKLLDNRLYGLKHRFEEVNGASRISEAIMTYTSKNENIELIAMINYWHSFFEKLTKENVIKRLAFYTEVPFLIFPLID